MWSASFSRKAFSLFVVTCIRGPPREVEISTFSIRSLARGRTRSRREDLLNLSQNERDGLCTCAAWFSTPFSASTSTSRRDATTVDFRGEPFPGYYLYYPARRQASPALRALIDYLPLLRQAQ